ncbi:MAG: ECF-type sigma factor, partial [Gemmataceae bacterium]|nr:ECF-type sigma factor [Gemmataceae bacterium]
MSDVTRLLNALDQGDPHAASQLLPLVYDELRRLAAQKLAREAPGQTLDATDRRSPGRGTAGTGPS